jgi:hypothetical protein
VNLIWSSGIELSARAVGRAQGALSGVMGDGDRVRGLRTAEGKNGEAEKKGKIKVCVVCGI